MTRHTINLESGFTLVELMIGFAISGIVISAAYSTYQQQLRSYQVQEDVSILQQDLRAAMYLLERDIRNAGLDPTGNAGAGFLKANSNEIEFTADFRGGESDGIDNDNDGYRDESDEWFDGDTNDPTERVRYAINTSQRLGREWSGAGGLQPVADNVEAINFVYLDVNGNAINDDGSGGVSSAHFRNIRSVVVTVIARGDKPDREYTDSTVYTNQLGITLLNPGGDNYRRRLLVSNIKCRNRGLRSS